MPYMLIIAVNFPNVFPCSWACVWSTDVYKRQVYALLVQIERPSQLSDEERLLYGWLNAYVHYKRHNSMAEDS